MTDSHLHPPGLTRRNHCRLCGSGDLQLAVPMSPTPLGDHYLPAAEINQAQPLYPLDLYLCSGCGHVQNLDVVNPDMLFRHYNYVTSSSASLLAHFEQYTREVTARAACQSGSLVVDIGSNDGSLLAMFRDSGFKVLGVDAAVNVAKLATSRGIQTLPEYFTPAVAARIVDAHGQAEIVTANNVFAHADQLDDLAAGVGLLLSDSGVFVFEVSYLVDVVDRFLFDTVYHEHVSYHSIGPLRRFLAKHGLVLTDVDRIASKGGSIRCFAQKASGAKVAAVVDDLEALERHRGFDRLDLYRQYTADIASRREQLQKVLLEARAKGHTIAGFGASITVTTLLYNMNLTHLIDFIVDDNATKHGLYSPGAHIPVMSPSALMERKPEITVILAWNYAEQIASKHTNYLAQGGSFVVPLPDLRVIKAP